MKMEIDILKGNDDELRHRRNHKVPLPNGNYNGGIKSLFDSCTRLDLVLWLRQLALDPCEMGASKEENKKMCHHILNMRKFMLMNTTKTPQRKRKLERFLMEKNHEIGSKFSKERFSVSSSQSYVLDSIDSCKSFKRQVVDNLHSSGCCLVTNEGTVMEKQMNIVDRATKYSFHLVESDESVNGSNLLIPENPTRKSHSLLDAVDSGQSSNSPGFAEPNYSSFPRLAIPIGPCFQAEVPTYTNNKKNIQQYKVSSENLRWLGTRVWPMECENMDINLEKIGKGRPDSCSCKSPIHSDCNKHHILEKRLDLRAEIGATFFTWNFDDMGEDVLKSWTLKEQKIFSSFRQKYLDDEGLFWEHVLKCLPHKCKKSILSYYFNVFVPKRLSIETKSSSKQIYSDDEEVEDKEDDNDKKGSRKKCKSRSDVSKKLKNVKKRFMRHAH